MSPIVWGRQRLSLLGRWWHRAVWEDAPRVHGWLRRLLRAYVRAWDNTVRSYGTDLISMRANALTFRTLLALVPLLAVVFSLFQAFGGLEASERALRQAVLANLAPGSAAVALDTIESFVARVSAGAIGGVGVVAFFIAVIALLTYAEESFNALWGIARVRPFLPRFVLYWALVSVGPVLLALSLSFTATVRTGLLTSFDAWFPGNTQFAAITLRVLPWITSCLALVLLYLVVPNTRVRFDAALAGGLFAGVLWELGKSGFTAVSIYVFRYSAVYGSFAALPVFLIWLQLGWTIVLIGCKVTHAFQYMRALQEERSGVTAGPALREFIAVRCMLEVTRAYQEGVGPRGPGVLAGTTEVPLAIEKDVLNRLVECGLLLPVPDDGKSRRSSESGDGYVPGRDPSTIRIHEIIHALRDEGSSPETLDARDPTSIFVHGLLGESDAAAGRVTDVTLADAVERIKSQEPSEPTAGATQA